MTHMKSVAYIEPRESLFAKVMALSEVRESARMAGWSDGCLKVFVKQKLLEIPSFAEFGRESGYRKFQWVRDNIGNAILHESGW